MGRKSSRKSNKNKRKIWTSLLPTTAFFDCPKCHSQWYDYNLGFDKKKIVQICINAECNAKVHPFTIKDRCHGNFICQKCKKQWFSAYTFALTFQKCKGCRVEVLPHRMRPLIRSEEEEEEEEEKKPHLGALCGMCLKLGHRCSQDVQPDDVDEIIDDFSSLEIE